jgi:hypothetical protein
LALEFRNGRVYYYASERIGRSVIKRYGASGSLAYALSIFDATGREERKLRAEGRADRVNRLARIRAKLRKWLARVNSLVADALVAEGWHQHNRGEWRRKRGKAMTTGAATIRPRWHGPELAQLAGTMDPVTAKKAAKGDRSVIAAVEAFLDRPAAVILWGDMGRRVLERWVEKYAGSCRMTERALLRFAADLRERLAGPNPDALVQLVAERVVIGWVALSYFEHQYAGTDKLTVSLHEFYLARIEMAHRSLMSACRTLAKIKRARLPDLLALVNVAPQVPTAAATVTPATGADDKPSLATE